MPVPCPRVRHWRRATAASPRCSPARCCLHNAAPSACSMKYYPVEARTRICQYPAQTPLFPPPSSPVPPPSTTHSTPRLLCDLQVEGTGLLSRLQQLCCRCLFRVLARHHQARHPVLHVCVCMHMSACVYICVIYTICNIYLIICTCVRVCVCVCMHTCVCVSNVYHLNIT